jgi:adenylate cyclase
VSPDRLTATELAGLVGADAVRIATLTAHGLLRPDDEGRYPAGDAHRVRIIEGFEAAGVPLEVLLRAQDAGLITLAYYDELHLPPGTPSGRTYASFRVGLGDGGGSLASVFAAFGIAEPDAESRLSVEDESFLADQVSLLRETGELDLTLGILRQQGEAARRAAVAALETYREVIERMDPDLVAGVPTREVFDRHFLPWAKVARGLPDVARWLAAKHLGREIDQYSVQSTERMLEQSGYVPERPERPPAVAFVDLTGFTALAREQGDRTAADVALHLAEVAGRVSQARRGRVVKLLGDGVLLHFAEVVTAVEASSDLLDELEGMALPPGHVGVAEGPIIARDGDIFGRTVNLAARISDATPSGLIYVPADTGLRLADRYDVEAVGPIPLAGLGSVDLSRVRRRR